MATQQAGAWGEEEKKFRPAGLPLLQNAAFVPADFHAQFDVPGLKFHAVR